MPPGCLCSLSSGWHPLWKVFNSCSHTHCPQVNCCQAKHPHHGSAEGCKGCGAELRKGPRSVVIPSRPLSRSLAPLCSICLSESVRPQSTQPDPTPSSSPWLLLPSYPCHHLPHVPTASPRERKWCLGVFMCGQREGKEQILPKRLRWEPLANRSSSQCWDGHLLASWVALALCEVT